MEEDSQTNSKVFRVRIVSIDFYMASPIRDLDICYSSFHGENAKEVPVIRVYGPTPAGQKTCLHIHRVLPYFYVACSEIPLESNLQGDAYLNAVSLAFEKALKLRGNVGSKRQHVHGCSLVRAKMLYGYHASEDLFIKIYLYYPHDVSRAANLLLDGAVFDRSLQPYESHIPFLLQFMVDYNLYGMGHLHLAKMKFRHPVPDDFHSRKVQSIGAYDTSCTPANSQADSVGSLCSDSPIWRASTIPNNCTWQCSSKLSASLNQDSHPVKRQSICELELDTTVDDILNQQFKMYTSLSQTGSDTKMVQSLVSLWEEEYERSGTHETEVLAQLGGLSPKDVLRTLSDGLDYEKKLLELCDKAHQTLSTRSSNDVKLQLARSVSEVKGVDGETQNQDRVTLEGTGLQEKSHISISVVSELQVHGGNSSGEGRGKCISSAVEMLPSKITEDHDSMPVKEDALTILEWLASTQALEDVNSDDELVRETILSPLLQAETISKVLEKANLYYESESQQECQDILDSVVDVVNFNNLRQKSSVDENMSSAVISDKMIPQVDGAGDDDPSTPLARSSKVKKDIKLKSSQSKMSESSSSVSSRKRKRDTLPWGSLPLSEHKSVSRDVHTASREASDNFHDETGGETFDAGSLARDERQIDSVDLSHSCSSASFQHLVDTRVLHGCSVRDLMRKKRCHRDAGSEWGNSRHKEDSSAEVLCLSKLDSCQELFKVQDLQIPQGFAARSLYSEHQTEFCGTIISTSRNGFEMTKDNSQYHKRKEHEVKTTSSHTCARDLVPLVEQGPKISDDNFFVGGDSQKKLSSHPRCLSPCNPEVKVLHKYDNGGKAGGGVISEDLFTDTEPQVLEETNVVAVASQSVHSSGAKFGRSDFSKSLAAPDKMPFGCSYTKNCKNLHPDGQICKESENVLVSAAITNIPGEDDHNYEEHSVKGRSLDVLLPLFSDDSVQHYKVRSCSQSSNDVASKPAGSVPIQCKKDVPYSYLLTPLSSPPSADSVFRWLSLRETGALKADSDAELSLSSSPESNAIQKLSSQTNVSSASKLIYNQKNEDKHKIPDVKEHILYKEMGILIQEENKVENVMKSSPDRSQISGPSGRSKPTPLSQIGFRDPASIGKGQQLTLLSIEVQAEARGELQPDPQFDAINIIALAIQNDSSPVVDVQILMRTAAEFCGRNIDAISGCKLFSFCEEKDLMDHFMKIVDSYDPDILIGWDVQGGSLGFLAERAFQLGIGLLNKISRASSETKMADSDPGVVLREKMVHVASDSLTTDTIKLGEDTIIEDEWGRTHMSGVRVGGRIVLNVWRLMRSEVKLNMYSVEAVTQAVLRRKVPSIHCKVLHKWYSSGPGRARYQCIEYIICRAKLNLEIMNQLDMINRTSELARIFGIDFFSVLSRGSQYRVESMMIRLAHTQNYVAISPGYQQVASQPAMECQPLVMEPESGFYADPVVVLDFQSLYPSMLIAYNLCFSTCLGKVVPSKPDTLGVSTYSPDLHVLRDVNEEILLTPNGVMYVPTKSRKGILPRLLEEILSTRIMVKKAMKKLTPSQQILHRILDARQLALKLIANVTYGYTAAGFSGRMPCAELADSIVQCGRRTLENAISFVNSHTEWDARVVYGDTDSMFVLLKGRTLKEAFLIGREIASSITALNPYPVTLKMEKVYQPCFLLTKKRYVGYSFETVDQVKPMFDAKGIETVRRDTCGAVSKIMERSLRLFFEHQEIFKVRAYLQRQWSRILSGRLSVEDFVFAKEVRLGTYRATSFSSLPPAAIVATKALRADPRAEPRYAERVPYVVVHGEPGSRLVDMVVDPLDLLAIDSPYRLNDLYYINKQIIPALQRVFGLIGADLNQWFLEMPRPVRDAPNKHQFSVLNPQRTRIDYYYLSRHCVLCGQLVHLSNHLCDLCSLNGAAATAVITGRTSKLEREIQHLASICRHCGGGDWIVESGVKCTSLACSVFYERRKIQKELLALSTVATDAGLYPKCMAEWF